MRFLNLVIYWLLPLAIASQCTPNTTFEGEAGVMLFCVPTAPTLYSDDDIVAHTNLKTILETAFLNPAPFFVLTITRLDIKHVDGGNIHFYHDGIANYTIGEDITTSFYNMSNNVKRAIDSTLGENGFEYFQGKTMTVGRNPPNYITLDDYPFDPTLADVSINLANETGTYQLKWQIGPNSVDVECPVNSCQDSCQDATSTAETTPKYGVSVIGNLCACNFNEAHPDPDIQDGTTSITCVDGQPLSYLFATVQGELTGVPYGTTGALANTQTPSQIFRTDYANYIMNVSLRPAAFGNVTMSSINKHLPTQVLINGGACTEEAPTCSGFHADGRFGICQKVNMPMVSDETPIFKYGVDGSNAPGQCNCYNADIVWAQQLYLSGNPPPELQYYTKQFDPIANMPGFEWAIQGWHFSNDDLLSLVIPYGDTVQTRRVKPTGTKVNGMPCGTVITAPPNSITLDSFCMLKPKADMFNPSSTDFNLNAATVMHGTSTLCKYTNPAYNGKIMFQRFRLGEHLWDDLAAYEDEDRDGYVALMVILMGVDASAINPSHHGSWLFPTVVHE
jgi:hypothetical protein